MKCTFRLLVLSGAAFCLLLLILSRPNEIYNLYGKSNKRESIFLSMTTSKPQNDRETQKICNQTGKCAFINSESENSGKINNKPIKPIYYKNNITPVHYKNRSDEKSLKTFSEKLENMGTVKDLNNKFFERLYLAVVCCGERVEETKVMLKSAVVLSNSPITLIVFTEEKLKNSFENMVTSWPEKIKSRVKLDLHTVGYPPGQDEKTWKNLFKPCSSQRLFFPSILNNIDSLLYVDTDVLFLSPLENLWNYFKLMNESQMAAVAPEHEDLATGWYNRFAKHPYYGRLGVNSGVMLMNLTRLRNFGWEKNYVVPVYKQFKSSIIWGDQDIINIIFHYHPDKLYIYGCEYNMRPDHCMYMSVCKGAELHGVHVVHGNRGVFHKDKQPAFKAIYQAWKEYQLENDLRQDLYYPMQRYLQKTMHTTCGKLQAMFLKALKKLIVL